MNVARSVFVKRHRFEKNVLASFAWFLNIDQFEQVVVTFEDVWVALFANFTLKFFPVITCNVLTIFFHMPLSFYPIFQTLKVN